VGADALGDALVAGQVGVVRGGLALKRSSKRLAYQSRPRSQFSSVTKKFSSFGFDIWISGCRPR
jgi:hypothetical protein